MKNLLNIFLNFIIKDRKILTTSINDAFPFFRSIEDYPAHPISKEIRDEFKHRGIVSLKPGVYDFYLKSFCLNAGKYGPSFGSGYLIAPIKGRNSKIIRHILENSIKHSDISQSKIQTLIWAILSNTKYRDFSEDLQIVTDKLLEKDDLRLLGKSFLNKIPEPIRAWFWKKIKKRLPKEIFSIFDSINEIKSKIKDVQATYKELESIAVRFGKPPVPKNMLKIKQGTWSLIKKRCFVRVFPEGYSRTRMQVYIPERIVPYVKKDDLGRINEMGIKDGINIKITFDDSLENSKITLHDGQEIPIWRFKKLKFSAPTNAEIMEIFEIKNTGWVARDIKALALLDAQKYPEIKNKIEKAADIHSDIQMFKKIASKESKESSDDIFNEKYYYDMLNDAFKNMSKGAMSKEIQKLFFGHLKKIMDAYGNIGSMLGNIFKGSDSEAVNFGSGDTIAIPANTHEQRLGFDGLFDDFD
ncbi:MAG: hypothetical protein WBC21_02785 [Minisyncoccales bacterium]